MVFIKEFKQFALRGNVADMAVGIIIGAAFGKIVTSLVDDIIMPPMGLLLGGVDFSKLQWELVSAAEGVPGTAIRYGVFINALLDFIIVAFAIFVLIKLFNNLRAQEKKAAPNLKDCPECRMSIPLHAQRCGHCTTKLES
jgi:large conductance mechanosensitive channel